MFDETDEAMANRISLFAGLSALIGHEIVLIVWLMISTLFFLFIALCSEPEKVR